MQFNWWRIYFQNAAHAETATESIVTVHSEIFYAFFLILQLIANDQLIVKGRDGYQRSSITTPVINKKYATKILRITL